MKPVTYEVVKDVIKGKYGNGVSRMYNLENAGYNYKQVQRAVNRLLIKNDQKRDKIKRRKNKIKNIISYIITIICILALLWVGISYIEVVSKNLSENPQYWSFNFFELFFGRN